MRVTFTSASDWRRCQQVYYYSYIEGLQPKQEFAPPLQMGRVVHKYLEHFYAPLKAKRRTPVKASTRHRNALMQIDHEFTEPMRQLAVAAQVAGENELSTELAGLVPKAARLCQAYFDLRGHADTHRVLMCEEYISFPLTAQDEVVAIIDLVTQDEEGNAWIWEHKTSANIPNQSRRLRDLQTILGAALVEEARGVKAAGVIWNYFRTKEPTAPRLLKTGGLSQDKSQDTTWQAFEAAIKTHKLDLADYADMQRLLANKAETVFFPRMQMPLFQSEQVLLRDLISTCGELRAATSNPEFVPIRNIGLNCDWCRYTKLCEAVLLGGDDDELKRMLFKAKGVRDDYSAA